MNGPKAERGIPGLAPAVLTAHVVTLCGLAYFASARLVDATGMLLHRVGMARADAVVAASMAGFLYLLFTLIWAFSRRSLLRQWLSVGGLTGLALLMVWMIGVKT